MPNQRHYLVLWLITMLTGAACAQGGDETIPYSTGQLLNSPPMQNFLVGDLDGDDDDDAVYIPFHDEPIIIRNNRALNFSIPEEPDIEDRNKVIYSTVNDFDGDGDFDILVIRENDDGDFPLEGIFMNDGGGRFNADEIDLGNTEENKIDFEKEVYFQDVDADGDADLIYDNPGRGVSNYNIHINEGLSFSYHGSTPGHVTARQIQGFEDIDGDGNIDMLIKASDGGVSNISILRYDAEEGTHFTKDTLLYETDFLRAITGDVNNDGFTDIIFTTESDGGDTLFINTLTQDDEGAFSFSVEDTVNGIAHFHTMYAMDIDSDADLDFIITDSAGQFLIFEFKDGSRLVEKVRIKGIIVPGNLDDNGNLDLFYYDGDIGTYTNTGGFNFVKNPDIIISEGASSDIDIVDINNDGYPDIVQSGRTTSRFMINDGNGLNFSQSQAIKGTPHVMQAFGDIDGDSDEDMIAVREPAGDTLFGFDVWTNDGGTLSFSGNIGRGDFEVTEAKTADLDSDGDADMIIVANNAAGDYSLRVLSGDGAGDFSTTQTEMLSGKAYLEVEDVDSDEDIDVIIYDNANIIPYINDGTGTFSRGIATAKESVTATKPVLGDIDGDEDPDLIFFGINPDDDPEGAVFENDGTGLFTERETISVSHEISHLAMADVDNDNDPDMVAGVNNGIQLFINDGEGNFTLSLETLGQADANSVLVFADLDGNGTQDLVNGGTLVGNRIFLNEILGLGTLKKDSLVLVDFYHATGGDSWTDNTGWLQAGSRLADWKGIAVDENKVTEIKLPNNNLTGTIPENFEDLTGLTEVDLSGNALTGIRSDFTQIGSLVSVNLSDNMFDFGDFEVLGDLSKVTIGEQITGDAARNDSISLGSSALLSFAVDGISNSYQWYKNDKIVVGANASTLNIPSLSRFTMGSYYCEATSTTPGLEELTLTSANKRLTAVANISGVLKTDDTNTGIVGEVVLLRVTDSGAYDTALTVSVSDTGEYEIVNITDDTYLLTGVLDNDAHPNTLPTYYSNSGNTVFWEEADTLSLTADLRIDLTAVFHQNPNNPAAQGVFSGILKEELQGDGDGGRIEARGRVRKAAISLRRGRRGVEKGSGEVVHHTFTDDNGEFIIKNIEPNDYNLDIQYPGYPMNGNSFVNITIGTEPENLQIAVEALIDNDVITVKQVEVKQVDMITGTDEQTGGLSIFPNPTNETIHFDNPQRLTDLVIALYNDRGDQLITTPLGSDTSMAVGKLAGGSYIIKISDAAGNVFTVRRLIISR